MVLNQLRYFVSVVDVGNFTRAAEACRVSLPSLNQQIIKLEKELGRQLFERLGRSVRLTDAGKLLYDRATNVLATIDSTKSELQDRSDAGCGRLSIGAIVTAAPFLLPPLLKSFGRRFPNTEVIVHENLTERIIDECRQGDLDFGLVALPIDDRKLIVETLFEDERLLAVHHKHRLAKKRPIPLVGRTATSI